MQRVLASLRADKASFQDVLSKKEQAAAQNRRSTEYLSGLVSGRKAHVSSELRQTDELVSELNKLKLDTLELQSNARGVAQQLAAEEARRDVGVLQLQTQLESERAEQRAMRKKIIKEQSALQSKNRGGGASSVDVTAAVAASGAAAAAVFSAFTSHHAHSSSFSFSSSALGPSLADASATTAHSLASLEVALAHETRQRDLQRAEIITALNDFANLIAGLEAQQQNGNRKPRMGLAGSAGGATTATAAAASKGVTAAASGGKNAAAANVTPRRAPTIAVPTPRRVAAAAGAASSSAATPTTASSSASRGRIMSAAGASSTNHSSIRPSANSRKLPSGAPSARRTPSMKRLDSRSSVSSAGGSGTGTGGDRSMPGSPHTAASLSRAASRRASMRTDREQNIPSFTLPAAAQPPAAV
jgi:hypothetical protein